MRRVKVPYGSKVKPEEVFDNLQDFVDENISYRTTDLYGTFGAVNKTNNEDYSVDTNNLKIAASTAPSYMTRFTIQPGTALSESGEMLISDSVETKNLNVIVSSIAASTYYLIKMKWNLTGATPIPAMAGFKYDPAGTSAYSQRYSEYVDDFTVTADVITAGDSNYLSGVGTDEIPLAVLKTNASSELDETAWTYNSMASVSGVLDLRARRSLKLSEEVIPDSIIVVKNKDATGDNRVQATIQIDKVKTPNLTGVDGWMHLTNTDTTNLVYADLGNKRIGVNITPRYTFDVGGDMGLTGILYGASNMIIQGDYYGQGDRKVMYEPAPSLGVSGLAPSILNFRVDSVTSSIRDITPAGSLPYMAHWIRKGGYIDNLDIILKWNYDDVVGTGGVSTFSATCSGVFTENQIAGYYLLVPGVGGGNLVISGNAATVGEVTSLSVYNIDGTSWDGTGIVIDSNNPAWIHSNAEKYEIVVIPRYNSSGIIRDMIRKQVYGYNSTTADMEETIKLKNAQNYVFKVRAVRGIERSAWVSYPSTGEYLLLHENITNDGVLTGESATFGFTVSIAGWEEAEKFEIVYAAGESPDFAGTSAKRIITSDRLIEIKTDTPTMYLVRARPLIGGQQVITNAEVAATEIEVIAGGGGSLPQDQVIVDTDIMHRVIRGTYSSSGTPSTSGTGKVIYDIALTDIKTPTNRVTTNIPNRTVGDVVVDDDTNEFIVEDIVDNRLLMSQATGVTSAPKVSGYFYAGTTIRGRRLYRSKTFTIDYELVQAAIEVKVLARASGTAQATLRIYQEGRSDLADIVTLTEMDTTYTVELDARLLGLYGDRNLIIDLWDPDESSPINDSTLVAHITIYARPKPPRRILDYERKQKYLNDPTASWGGR